LRQINDRDPADPQDAAMEKIRIEQHSSIGLAWIAGWLFSLGYLQLTFWKGLFALLIWPYYIGAHFAPAF
jgi:hypothetical protein